jgi:hypothetical protein
MAKWHHLKNKETGEEQRVGNLDGYDLELFEVTELERRPEEDDDFDPVSKKLKKNPGRKAKRDREMRASRHRIADLLETIDNLTARIEALEKRNPK